MSRWESKHVKNKEGVSVRVQVPMDKAAKLKAGPSHESVVLGLWKPSEDKEYQAALKEKESLKKRVEDGKLARMRQN